MSAHSDLLSSLRHRFTHNLDRHTDVAWVDVEARLKTNTAALNTLAAMEASGGEPDVVGREGDAFVFVDCAPESPAGRRSLCFDDAALAARKQNKPAGSALGLAAKMGADILTEDQYRALQTLGAFDQKTSSWIATPPAIRAKGGGLFCDRRYGAVFTYHNGADSYYAARGFRARLVV